MPTYAYACTECDHRFEAQQAFTDDALSECPECAGRLRKLFNAVGIVFKGSGFYRTDSRPGSASGAAGSAAASGESSSGEAGGKNGTSGKDAKTSSDSASSSSSSTASSSDSGSSGGSSTSSKKTSAA